MTNFILLLILLSLIGVPIVSIMISMMVTIVNIAKFTFWLVAILWFYGALIQLVIISNYDPIAIGIASVFFLYCGFAIAMRLSQRAV